MARVAIIRLPTTINATTAEVIAVAAAATEKNVVEIAVKIAAPHWTLDPAEVDRQAVLTTNPVAVTNHIGTTRITANLAVRASQAQAPIDPGVVTRNAPVVATTLPPTITPHGDDDKR